MQAAEAAYISGYGNIATAIKLSMTIENIAIRNGCILVQMNSFINQYERENT